MKRRDLLIKGGGGAAVLAASSLPKPAIAQSAPEVRWRITASWPKSLDVGWGGCETFARLVGEMTDQKFQIQAFAAGEIVPALQAWDAVQTGTVECAHTAAYYYVGKDPVFTFGTQLPFYFNSRQNSAWLHQGGGNAMLNEFFKKYNVTHFQMGTTGTQMGGFFRKEILKPEDWRGLKFRIGGWAGAILAKIGVVPQQIAGGDIYPALEKGTIDAAEWVGPYDDEKQGFHKVAPYYYYPGWWEGGPAISLIVNTQKYEALPKAYKAAIQSAAAYAHNEIINKYDDRNPQALKRLLGSGVQFRVFSPEVMDACFKAANELYEDQAKASPEFKKIYDHLKGYWADQAVWWQAAELTMDTYSVQRRLKQG